MALLLFDGFEIAPLARNSGILGGPNFVGSATGRDGIGLCIQASSNQTNATYPLASIATCIFGVGIRLDSGMAGSGNSVVDVRSDGTSTTHLTFNFDSLGHLTLRRGNGNGTIIATSAATFPFGVWHYVEMKCTIDSASGICVIKVNGVTAVNFTGNTRNGGTLTSISALVLNLNGFGTQKFDDLVVMDGTGSAPYNDFIGERVVRPMRPNGAGASTALTPSSAVANYTTVDENPWSPTADYVSGTTGTDTYATSDVSGMASVDAVQEVAYALKTDSGARNIRTVARTAGGTIGESSDSPLSTTIAVYQGPIRLTDPDAAAWTPTSVNASQFGVKVT